MPEAPKFDKLNVGFIAATHLLAVFALLYVCLVQFSWWSLGLGTFYALACSMSITAGYHRLFAHPTHRAHVVLRVLYLFFGSASVQNSALKWSSDHRLHHGKVDLEEDPYNIGKGFWWAHIGWVLQHSPASDYDNVRDLKRDPLVMWQHNHYFLTVAISTIIMPLLMGLLWGDPIGAFLLAGALRLVIEWHSTFSVNSLAHFLGSRPYSLACSARDSFITALITMGEGYHNFHHRFANDYRNGVRWFHFDPTKWWVWSLSKVHLTWDLKRVSKEAIQNARKKVEAEIATLKLQAGAVQ